MKEELRDPAPPAADELAWPHVERRAGRERRARPTRFWDALVGWSRRQRGRRKGERDGVYVDVYRLEDALLVIGILVLNVLDAYLTLRHLQNGGGEANPLMARLLEAGQRTFLFQKTVVVAAWLLLLVVHKEFRLAYLGLWVLFLLYAALFGYHLAIVAGWVPTALG